MAVGRGFRPTSLLLRKQPHSKWSRLDFLLFEAHEIYEAEHSNSHGLPMWLTRSGDPNLGVQVDAVLDIADAELAAWDEKENKKKKPQKGLSRFARLVTLDGSPLPTGGLAREAGLIAQAKLFAEMEESAADGLDIERRRPAQGYNPADYGDGIVDSA